MIGFTFFIKEFNLIMVGVDLEKKKFDRGELLIYFRTSQLLVLL